MNKANYLTATTENGSGMYPLSVETLEFIQQQIATLQSQVAALTGYTEGVIRYKEGDTPGVYLNGGEFLEYKSEKENSLSSERKEVIISEETSDITADNLIYKDAITKRSAYFGKRSMAYTPGFSTPPKEIPSLKEVAAGIVPIGAVILLPFRDERINTKEGEFLCLTDMHEDVSANDYTELYRAVKGKEPDPFGTISLPAYEPINVSNKPRGKAPLFDFLHFYIRIR